MASAILSSVPLTAHEALSGISGIISLAAWFLLLLPQLYENYANQSADGISLAFLLVWFAGDVANLAGALWGGLLPTIVALGIYFCILDAALIAQTLYYKIRNKRRREKAAAGAGFSHIDGNGGAVRGESSQHASGEGEDEPLLNRQTSYGSHDSTGNLPYTRRRSSVGSGKQLPTLPEEMQPSSTARMWTKNILAVIGVCAVGTALWALAYKFGWWKPQPEETGRADHVGKDVLGSVILGYISNILYLGARVPQIWKNWREKSCEGLSLLFFMLSTLGNATYGTQILFHSVEPNYFLKNLPWLIGSLGTIAEDVIIFVQFNMYEQNKNDAEEDGRVVV